MLHIANKVWQSLGQLCVPPSIPTTFCSPSLWFSSALCRSKIFLATSSSVFSFSFFWKFGKQLKKDCHPPGTHSWTACYFLWRGCWCCQCYNPRSKICFEVDCMPQCLCWKRAMECDSNERGVSSSIYNHSANIYQRQGLVYFNNHIAITFDTVNRR